MAYAPQPFVRLPTRSGLILRVRRVGRDDESALATFFKQVTPDDLRFRFLTGVREVSHERLRAMIDVDASRTDSFLATGGDDDAVIAAAMLARDSAGERAEVAVSVRSDRKDQGIGWTLLEYLSREAETSGVKVLEAIESRANHQAIALEHEMGFTSEPMEGDATVVLLRRRLAPS
ncbi:MAG: N-acetyltransferase [Sphingomonas bacterium]|uniref:GNAT family N-acetyltransferase n=1 Tax=Sphingomonas bacterium TaxID=1895847 RepID=UPI0026022EA9|nr:GNAT family N-acetyltransferase [Sphingomonas bacterium]MDB5696117.1 N-acetyltransferase [Sphingomonas bacterium]